MFTITNSYINSYGMDLVGHLLEIRDVRYTETINTYQSTENTTPDSNTTRNMSFRVESYVSEDAKNSGAMGLPVSKAGAMAPTGGYYQYSLDEAIPAGTTLLQACELAFMKISFPENEPLVVPFSITRRQARQQLLNMGELANVEAIIAAIVNEAERATMSIYWNDSNTFERSHPFLISLSTALGWTADELDEAFIAASKL